MKTKTEPLILPLAECRFVIPTLAAWHHRQWADLNPGDTVEARARRLGDQGRGTEPMPVTWVALSGGAPAGSASLVANDMETRPDLSPWLATVFVEPGQRGRGIGAALVDRVGGEALRLGFRELYLFTPDRAGWYARLGWTEMETVLYRGTRVTLMKRPLGNGPRNG